MVNIINAAMLYMKVKRENPEFSSQGKDTFFSFPFILSLYGMMDVP